MRYFDLYHGVELKPAVDGEDAVLSFDIEANGYGAILATPGEPSAAMKEPDAAHGGDDGKTADGFCA